uniref:Up-regulator of cell proliferation-like domain-containing protein n=1 Tax=Hippocampus comes TaxID=109280 RepID=A0A3Q2Y873_HIPCM
MSSQRLFSLSLIKRSPISLTVLFEFLSNLGLQKYHPNKFTLQSLLEVNKSSIYEKVVLSEDEIPFYFLRKLFQINAGCRYCTQILSSHEEHEDSLDILDIYTACGSANTVHPLDLIQEMALKMSLCQFSLPLLVPHCNNNLCTLMLWALREIVKEWCPHDLCQTRGFAENNIVQATIPFFSFVRLKNCSLSKSRFLNDILSCGQQNHNMFLHRDMQGAARPRKISNTLVEVCWFLPCGRANLDIFPEPVTFANLRGDICESLTQFTFLYEVSNAIFVFLDKIEDKEHQILTALQDAKSKIYFVVNLPCEAGGKEHSKHHAAVHRPKGLGRCMDYTTNVLTESLCTTDVQSNKTFKNISTQGKWVDYKKYATIFPDWHIPKTPQLKHQTIGSMSWYATIMNLQKSTWPSRQMFHRPGRKSQRSKH